ncbi:amidohydrolase family protein [Acidisoma cellulosilytica]|uniref:Amidohydrolase family protein n=1 Tax=Acidisoma cellulosilyticum TaxID=2802395 RepID=A0A963Z1X8_9PROT|nr:amidohydrolase family protein [Acidisoma cellulosilyticum]MCB8881338.1 amidohydrolase family protein [Acidisoma cellulosilyticum]
MTERLYSGPIIDAHHHLWDLTMGRHKWLMPSGGEVEALGGLDALRTNYLVEDFRADSARQRVVGSVHIEALWDRDDLVGETRWLETLDKSDNIASRYIANAGLGTPGAAAVLEEQASFPRVVGVREILSWHPDPKRSFATRSDIAEDPAWRADLALLPQHGLIFELMMYPYQAAMVSDLARRYPQLQFVVNHCGSPIDRDADGMQRWRDGLVTISQHENVALKISNMAAYDKDRTEDSLRAVAMHCLDCFGVARTMLATDYPVARLQMTYDAIYENFKQIFAPLSQDEQSALFHDNAARMYRFDEAV